MSHTNRERTHARGVSDAPRTPPEESAVDRRTFLRRSLRWGSIAGGLIATGHAPASPEERPSGSVNRYVRLGRTGLEISDISFGASRLRSGGEHLVEHALARGVNYFDTAEDYTSGMSETVIGNALQGKRDQVVIASKTWANPSDGRDELMQRLEGSLKRLRTDYVDVYFNHAVNNVSRLNNQEWYEFVDRARQQGKLRFTGMSGHAGKLISCLDHALDEDLVDVVLVATNFGQDPAFYERFTRTFDYIAMQPDLPRVLQKAHAKDVGVIAMKTLMGARLNDMRPFETPGATFAQAAFRWILSNDHVDALIISMTSSDKIDEYLAASGWTREAPGDLALLKRYAHLNGATYCRHACAACDDACPAGVPIADVLRTRMYAVDYQDAAFARDEYAKLPVDATACLSCDGQPCQNACPNGLVPSELTARTHRMLT